MVSGERKRSEPKLETAHPRKKHNWGQGAGFLFFEGVLIQGAVWSIARTRNTGTNRSSI